MVRGKKMIVCTVLCYSLGFQGSGHGYGIGYGLHFGQCSLGGLEDGYFGWFSGGLDILRGDCWNQPPNHLVEKGQPWVFTPFLQSREVMLCQKTRNRPRSFGLVVPSNEAHCVTLDALQLADILLLVRVPDDGTVL